MQSGQFVLVIVGLLTALIFFVVLIWLMRWMLKLDVIAANSIAQTRLLILLAKEKNVSPINLKWAAEEVEYALIKELMDKAEKQDSERAPKG